MTRALRVLLALRALLGRLELQVLMALQRQLLLALSPLVLRAQAPLLPIAVQVLPLLLTLLSPKERQALRAQQALLVLKDLQVLMVPQTSMLFLMLSPTTAV